MWWVYEEHPDSMLRDSPMLGEWVTVPILGQAAAAETSWQGHGRWCPPVNEDKNVIMRVGSLGNKL